MIICISFTDRKKDLVKLLNGEYLSLGKVESELKGCSLVESICIYADGNKEYAIALMVPIQAQVSTVVETK